jgi:hypothetical protein
MTGRRAPAAPAGTATDLRILSQVRWPEREDDVLTPIPAFTLSSFNPLVIEAAERCLARHHGPAPAPDPARARRTALILASTGWDRGTARALAAAVRAGDRVPPLLFFQSNPNAVLGYVAARWGLGGPVVCVGPPPGAADAAARPVCEDSLPAALDQAALVLGAGDAEDALVIAAEQGRGPREPDGAVALLVTRNPG